MNVNMNAIIDAYMIFCLNVDEQSDENSYEC